MENIPVYLKEILNEATAYFEEDDNISRVGAAHEIAHQHESLVVMDDGERDALELLRDIRTVHTLCGDEFETYRQGRNAEYADSILEAVALRSLEELINVHLHSDQSFDKNEPATAQTAK
ncbi:hypothetical protein [Halorubrum sp. AJ67]|uniref:hypothetical protein n=1 Tax=Halorubrum sp. AJ67 TaxID=1173487 RepID=UPI0003DD3B76|nr:hypothetical protein [Halorubrum sp. AJ67]CDK38076.1 hypothetical protein BN903_276 [Halorubrum sp. AJ67]